MSDVIVEGAQCRANFSGPGRARRKRIAQIGAVISVVLFGVLVYFDVAWPWRLLVGLPVAGTLITGLQVTRNTCVAHAASGSFENEDFSLTKVDEAFAAASRKVASTIFRDAAIGALLVAAIAAATAFVF